MWSCSGLLLTHLDLAGSCVDRLFTIAAGTGCPFRRCWCSGATASAATGDGAVVAAARAAGGGTVCVFYIGFNLQSEGHTLLAAVLLWGKFGWNAVDLDVDADLLQWVPEDLDSVQWAGAQRLRHVAEAVRKRYVHLNDAFAWAGLLPLLHLFALHELQAALVETDLDHALQEGMGGENRGFCEKWQEVKSFGKFIRTRRFHMYNGMVMPRISQVARLNWGLLKSIEPSIYTCGHTDGMTKPLTRQSNNSSHHMTLRINWRLRTETLDSPSVSYPYRRTGLRSSSALFRSSGLGWGTSKSPHCSWWRSKWPLPKCTEIWKGMGVTKIIYLTVLQFNLI